MRKKCRNLNLNFFTLANFLSKVISFRITDIEYAKIAIYYLFTHTELAFLEIHSLFYLKCCEHFVVIFTMTYLCRAEMYYKNVLLKTSYKLQCEELTPEFCTLNSNCTPMMMG